MKNIKARQSARQSERGNVFFTLFGAVAILGVLGAGIVATMRGPLTTMVEVNRQEQAKAELRNNASFVLLSASDDACEAAPDGYTEGPAPETPISPALVGGGAIPASIAAVKNDPWGTPYGYCAWDHGDIAANQDGCDAGTHLSGNTSTNNIAVAIISAGPDREFQTDCLDDPTYLSDIEGEGDDLVNAITYTGAVEGSDGLWTVVDADTAGIEKDIQVGGDIVIDPTGSGTGQLQLGAQSMLLPDHNELVNCNAGNNLLPRVNDSGPFPIIEICDGDNSRWIPAGSLWSIKADGEIFFNSDFVGIGNNDPTVPLEVTGNTILDGQALITNILTLDEGIVMKDGKSIMWDTGDASIIGNSGTLELTNAAGATVTLDNNTLEVTGDTIITGKSAAVGSALLVQNSTPSPVIVAQNDGNVAIGAASANDRLHVEGAVDTIDGYKIDDVTVVNRASTSILLGDDAGANVTGGQNVVIGANAGAALTTGTGNIIIGNGTNANAAGVTGYLNIGDLLHGNTTAKKLGVGYGASYDANLLASTFNVNGTFYVDGDTIMNAGVRIDGNITAKDDVVDIDDNLEVTGDITAKILSATNEIFVDGAQLGPPAECAIEDKLSWDDTGGWSCVDDQGGTGSGGTAKLDEVLAAGNDADEQDATNFGSIGADFFCNDDLTVCFDPASAGGIFEVDDGSSPTLVRTNNAAAPHATVDFVFGAPTLTNAVGVDDDARMYFDKSKGAFRAGRADSTEWDASTASVGSYSAAFGRSATASGTGSFAGGHVPSPPFTITASGDSSFAWGNVGSGNVVSSGTASISMGTSTVASANNAIAMGYRASATQAGAIALGRDATAAAANSIAFGAGIVPFGAVPQVSGGNSVVFFMGSHTGGLNVSATNTFAILGGKVIVDPTAPATQLATSEHEDSDGNDYLAMDIHGYLGAVKYCDEEGDDCFESADIAGGNLGIWQPDGTNNYIEYDDALGGVRIGAVSGQPAPESDWNYNIATSTVSTTSNTVAIGSGSTATGGDSDLILDVTGAAGADEYCDSNGDDCFTASEVGVSVFEVTGAPGSELVRQVAANAPLLTSDFLFGSTQLADTGNGDHDSRMFFDKSKAAFRAGAVVGTQWNDGSVGSYSIAMGTNVTAAGTYSTAFGDYASSSGAYSRAMGRNTTASGSHAIALGNGEFANNTIASGDYSIALGNDVVAGNGTAGSGFGNYSMAIGLGNATAPHPRVTATGSLGIFMGDQTNYVLSDPAKMALIGGEFQIDDVGASANKGCIRYNSADTKLEFSHDCSAYTEFGDTSGSSVFEVTGGAGTELVRQVAANAPIATSDFIFGATSMTNQVGVDDDARMYFDKSKSAFRAGTATGVTWDAGSVHVGTGSAAFGVNSYASGENSMAWGDSSAAYGKGSTAFGTSAGFEIVSDGIGSTAFGYALDANINALGDGDTAFGLTTTYDITADGAGSVAFGYSLLGPIYAGGGLGPIAFGTGAQAITDGAIAIGAQVIAGGSHSMAISLHGASVAAPPTVSGDGSLGIFMGDQDGYDFAANDKFALIGGEFQIDDVGASANKGCIRYNSADTKLEYSHDCSVVTPTYAEFGDTSGSAVFEVTGGAGTEVVRQVAGSAPLATSDFLFGATTLDYDSANASRMFFDKSKSAFRAGTAATTDWDAAQIGTGSVAFGDAARASGDYSFAMGNSTVRASAANAFAFGMSSTQASGGSSFAMGNFALASAGNAFSFGYHTNASNSYALAFGHQAIASGVQSFAFGREIIAGDGTQTGVVPTPGEGQYSIALGLGNPTTASSAEYPRVTGNGSIAAFSGDQASVNVNAENVAAFLGISMIINPDTTSASPAVPSTAGAGLELHVVGDIGAAQYCDEAGDNCFTAASASGSSVFEVTGGAGTEAIVQVDATAPFATSDFIIGSSQLDDAGGTDDDTRMFFDKSTGAFRAGTVSGGQSTRWDSADRGNNSAAFGSQNLAGGSNSFVTGTNSRAYDSNNVSLGNGNIVGISGGSVADTAIGIGAFLTVAGNNSTALGHRVGAAGEYSFAIGMGDAAGVKPNVSGDSSLGIFMGDQSAVDITATNTMALLGGKLVIDAAVPATSLAASEHEDSDGDDYLALDVAGYVGAQKYCDEEGDDCFTAANAGGLWTDLTGGRIHYGDDGTQQVGIGTNNPGRSLDVEGTMSLLSGATENIFIEGGNTTATGTHNIVVGSGTGGFTAGSLLGTGYNNIFMGTAAGGSATSAYQNVAIGYQSGRLNQSGRNSVYIGYRAGNNVRSTDVNTQNVAIGSGALNGVAGDTTGARNIAIGYNAGSDMEAGSDNILIGVGVQLADPDDSEVLNIGDILFGDIGTTSTDPRIGAHKYCDETLTTCFEAGDVISVFEVTGGAGTEVVRQVAANAPLATSDFLFGATTLDYDSTNANRMFFDKSKGAFRAGNNSSTTWNDVSRGTNSAAFGKDTIASGAYSMTWGDINRATGTNSTAWGNNAAATGATSTAIGLDVNASGVRSIAIGLGDSTGAGLAQHPEVTAAGIGSIGFFMGDQKLVDVATPNIMAILGGEVVIDPAEPATNLAPSAHEDTGTLALDVAGYVGAQKYCDDSGNDCFESSDVADSAIFEVTGGAGTELVRQVAANAPLATSDFVFGGTSLDNQVGGDDDKRLYFDKSKAAFRAGWSAGTEWDASTASVGTFSAAFGLGVTASGGGSMAFGNADSNPIIASGEASLAFGLTIDQPITASETGTIAAGYANNGAITANALGAFARGQADGAAILASGAGATAFGDAKNYDITASGAGSMAWGSTKTGAVTAEGAGSAAWGDGAIASGSASTAFGMSVSTAADGAIAMGNQATASGTHSMAIGLGVASTDPVPEVSGDGSLGIFMGDQNGVDLAANDTMAIMGGKVGIGTVTPATAVHIADIAPMLQIEMDENIVGGLSILTKGDGASSFGSANAKAWAWFAFGDDYIVPNNLGFYFFDGGVSNVLEYIDSTTLNKTIASASIAAGKIDIYNTLDQPTLIARANSVAQTNDIFQVYNNSAAKIAWITNAGMMRTTGANGFGTDDNTATANYGCIKYRSSSTKLQFTHDCSAGVPTYVDMGTAALSDITAATKTNTIDNQNFAQSWTWNTAANFNALTISSSGLTKGALVTMTNSNSAVGANGNVLSLNSSSATGASVPLAISNSGTGNSLYVADVGVGETTPFIIDSAGNVGIGMTTASVALDVNGDIEFTGTIADVSDRRLKQDIKPLKNRGSMLEKIGLIDTYSFVMKDDEKGRTEFGVMAQDMQKIFPELVSVTDDDMGTMTMNYVGLITPMIEATKELAKENDALKAEIAALKSQQDGIQDVVADLSDQVEILNRLSGQSVGKASFGDWPLGMLAVIAAIGVGGFAIGRRFQKAG